MSKAEEQGQVSALSRQVHQLGGQNVQVFFEQGAQWVGTLETTCVSDGFNFCVFSFEKRFENGGNQEAQRL